jgi:Protein of unknwon function (DUF3310)
MSNEKSCAICYVHPVRDDLEPCRTCSDSLSAWQPIHETAHETTPVAEAPTQSALHRQVGGDHYKNHKIQPIEYIHANNIPFAEGCVIKYVSRWREKNGIKDLEKAKHFIEMLIELETHG